MEVQRRHRTVQIQDQENQYVNKGKSNIAILPSKRQGLTVRGALGDLNSNLQAQRVITGKVAVAPAECDKKNANRALLRSNYSHVQSKIDTGLAGKVQPMPRLPLRREESTAGLAVRAAVRTRVAIKEGQTKHTEGKENLDVFAQIKKSTQEKKISKLPCVREVKDKTSKPTLKDSTESLGKLKLVENTESTGLINHCKLEQDSSPSISLPSDIEDIDAKDDRSPLLMSMYIKDIYKYLTYLEEKYPIHYDHLKDQTVITGKMRATLIDWLVEVQKQFSLVLETFHLSVGIIDRYLQAVPNVQRNKLQLIGVTALFIASKYEEIYAPCVSDFVYVTDNAYSKKDVFQCEKEIMTKLGFCLARPIPLSFLRRFVKAAHGTSKNHHLAKYFVDLCLVDYQMAHYRPSELAAAAICLSLHLLSGKSFDAVWTRTMSYYSGYTLPQIKPIITKIAKVVLDVENSKLKAVYRKYLDPTLARVSNLPQLKGDLIRELAGNPSP